jgi:sulfonate transport system substrate-binding protein
MDPAWYCREWLASLFREGGNIAPIWNRANGADTAVVALTWVDEYQAVFVRDDGPVRRLEDLRGSRLGLPLNRDLAGFQGAVSLHGLLTALDLAGLKRKHLTFADSTVDLAGGGWEGGATPDWDEHNGTAENRQIEALLSGDVDAIFLRAGAGIRATRNPRLRALVNLNQHPDRSVRLNNATLRPLTVDRAFLRDHGDLVVRYLAVLLRTATWAESHHDDVVDLLSTEAGDAGARDVVAIHGPDVHRSFAPALTPAFVKALEEQKNFLRDWSFLTADFNVANWVASEPLAAAQRLARTLPPFVDERDQLFSVPRQLGSIPGDVAGLSID